MLQILVICFCNTVFNLQELHEEREIIDTLSKDTCKY